MKKKKPRERKYEAIGAPTMPIAARKKPKKKSR